MTQRPRRTPTQRGNTRDSRQGAPRRPAQRRPGAQGPRPAQNRRPGQTRRPNPNAQRRRPPQGQRRRPARRRRNFKWLLALPVVAVILWFVLTHYVFLIRNVDVVGAGDMPVAEVVRLSGIPLGGRLNAVDVQAVQNSVESTGRLAFVSVAKKLPNTLVLTVRQRSRDAITTMAGKLLVLDADGYVVSTGDAAPTDNLPYVLGLKASTYRIGRQLDAPDSRLNAMKSVLEALHAQSAVGYVSEVNLTHLSDIELITRKGMVVTLGSADNMNNKIIWMVGALTDLESRGENLGRLDVSSGSKADFLSGATPTLQPVATPDPMLQMPDAGNSVDGPTHEPGVIYDEDVI